MSIINLLSVGSFFKSVLDIIIAIAILLLMVLIHELGHYIVGKILGFKIDEFAIGFGKAIFSKVNKKGEKISLRIFPLGGYCAFAGENDEEDEKKNKVKEEKLKVEDLKPKEQKVEIIENKKQERDYLLFNEQKPWKRILVYLAGVTFNFISALIFAFVFLISYGYDIPQVVSVKNGYIQNIVSQDAIYKVEGKDINFISGDTFTNLLNEYMEEFENSSSSEYSKTITLTVKHSNGEFEDIEAYIYQLKYDTDVELFTKNEEGTDVSIYCNALGQDITSENAIIGDLLYFKGENGTVKKVAFMGLITKPYPFPFFEAMGRTFTFTFGIAWIVIKTFYLLITFQLPLSQLGGPIATIGVIASAANGGFASILFLLPLLAANLAVFNILPFPALDGSHIVFTTIEWIRGKPINRTVESYIHAIGLLILFAFVIIVDIIQLLG